MSEFDLRALVREVAAQAVVVDPPSIAKLVLDRIERRDTRLALEQALPTIVQHTVSRGRSAVGTASTADHSCRDNHTKPVGGGRSAKLAGIREWWRRQLDEPLNVGPAKEDWKRLRDCTADDLDYAAGIRRDLARANTLAAEQIEQLADDLRTSGLETVGDYATRERAA